MTTRLKQLGVVNRVLGSLAELDAETEEIAGSLARKSPLENAASQTFRYNSSGDFAYRIASLVALNAANVRAILVSKTGSLRPFLPSPPDFMRARRLSARYGPQ